MRPKDYSSLLPTPQERLVEERAEILRSAIVSEVKAAGSFWKQLSVALLTGILAPLIIGGIIALAIVYDRTMLSATSVSEHVTNATRPSAR